MIMCQSNDQQIKQLPIDTINILRSGFSISNITDCIEELVLNAVDAKATCIAVRIDLEILWIQVVDNGLGIKKIDLDVLGNRYFTSKCSSVSDLKQNLAHYGFRGEALASIAEVSGELEIISRSSDTLHTYAKLFQSGEERIPKICKTIRPSHGTTITVSKFFYNMPVRRKRIKPHQDIEKIRACIECIALMHPQIAFTIVNYQYNITILKTQKLQTPMDTFVHLFGKEHRQAMKPIEHRVGEILISGHIGLHTNHNKSLQYFYVNKRHLLNTKLHRYLNNLLQGSSIVRCRQENKDISSSPPKYGAQRFGIFLLNISCPYSNYDICLKPQKTLVEFKDWDQVYLCLEELLINFSKIHNLTLSLDERFCKSGKQSPESVSESPTKLSNISALKKFASNFDQNLQEFDKTCKPAHKTYAPDIRSTVQCFPAKRKNIDVLVNKTKDNDDNEFLVKIKKQNVENPVSKSSLGAFMANFNQSSLKQKQVLITPPQSKSVPNFINIREKLPHKKTKPSLAQMLKAKADYANVISSLSYFKARVGVKSSNSENQKKHSIKNKSFCFDPVMETSTCEIENFEFNNKNAICYSQNMINNLENKLQKMSEHKNLAISSINKPIVIEGPLTLKRKKIHFQNLTAKQTEQNIFESTQDLEVKKPKIALPIAFRIGNSDINNCFITISPKDTTSAITDSENFYFKPINKSQTLDLKCNLPENVSTKESNIDNFTKDKNKITSDIYINPKLDCPVKLKTRTLHFGLGLDKDHCFDALLDADLHLSDSKGSNSTKEENCVLKKASKDTQSCPIDPGRVFDKSSSKEPLSVTEISNSDLAEQNICETFCCSHSEEATPVIKISNQENEYLSKDSETLNSPKENIPILKPSSFAMDSSVLKLEADNKRSYDVCSYSVAHSYKFNREMFLGCKVIGQVDNKFIAVSFNYIESDTSISHNLITLIDQHAADERIQLESILSDLFENESEKQIKRDTLEVPFVIQFKPVEIRTILNNVDKFMILGLKFEMYDDNSVSLLTMPCFLAAKKSSQRAQNTTEIIAMAVRDICSQIINVGHFVCHSIPQSFLYIINSDSCRSAIKFGDRLSFEECQAIICKLSKCKLPFQCAHGRPSLVPVLDLDKLDVSKKSCAKHLNIGKLKILKQKWKAI